jgi:polyisoprenyl-phosphate glycosyltransferase
VTGTFRATDIGTLWIVSPVYFDVESFLLLRERILSIIPTTAVQFVVVDDSAGRDADIAKLRECPDTSVVEAPFNLGHQRAIVHGVRVISHRLDEADVVVTLDSDGEDRPEDLPRLLDPLLNGAVDANGVVLALRTKRHESAAFKVGYLAFRTVFRALTGVVVRTGNYAAYRARVAQRTLSHPYFDLSYSSTFLSLDVPITYVPCERGTRYAGQSRMNTFKLVMHGLRMLMPFLDRIALRVLLVLLALFGLATCGVVAVLSVRLFTDLAVPGWATYTLLSLVVLTAAALGNAVVLFAVFAQSRGISLSNLERDVS